MTRRQLLSIQRKYILIDEVAYRANVPISKVHADIRARFLTCTLVNNKIYIPRSVNLTRYMSSGGSTEGLTPYNYRGKIVRRINTNEIREWRVIRTWYHGVITPDKQWIIFSDRTRKGSYAKAVQFCRDNNAHVKKSSTYGMNGMPSVAVNLTVHEIQYLMKSMPRVLDGKRIYKKLETALERSEREREKMKSGL